MQKTERKIEVLFLCTGNSCRSQMAEGWARHLRGDELHARSAGTNPDRIDPRAVRVMREVGVDISDQQSTNLEGIPLGDIDLVVTLCDGAREACPAFHGDARVVHRSFDDPPRLAEDAKGEKEALEHYRRVRDQIRKFVAGLAAAPGPRC